MCGLGNISPASVGVLYVEHRLRESCVLNVWGYKFILSRTFFIVSYNRIKHTSVASTAIWVNTFNRIIYQFTVNISFPYTVNPCSLAWRPNSALPPCKLRPRRFRRLEPPPILSNCWVFRKKLARQIRPDTAAIEARREYCHPPAAANPRPNKRFPHIVFIKPVGVSAVQLPGKATIDLAVNNKYNGKTLDFYYYKAAAKRLEMAETGIPVKNGKVSVSITHCSDYILSPIPLNENGVKVNPNTGVESSSEIGAAGSISGADLSKSAYERNSTDL